MLLLLVAAANTAAVRPPLAPANVNARLREQLGMAEATSNASAALAVGVRSLAETLRSDALVGACMPTDRDVRKHAPGRSWRVPLPERTPFFLDEGPGLEMRAVHACLDEELARAQERAPEPRYFDDILPPNKAAYLSDLLVLRALRAHPQRVLDPTTAALHFTGVTPHASLVANFSCLARTRTTHEQRMRLAAAALREKAALAARMGSRTLYVIMHPSWNWRAIGTELRALLREPEHRERFVVVTGDRTYAARISRAHAEAAVLVPYVASARLDQLARAEHFAIAPCARGGRASDGDAPPHGAIARLGAGGADGVDLAGGGGADIADAACARGSGDDAAWAKVRPISCYFVGNMHRQRGEGKVRFKAVEALSTGAPRGRYVDRVFRQQNVHRLSYAEMAVECAREMRGSRFCLAPAGDVPTSRRLPDALAAGCVPVHIGRFELMRSNLPFPHHVDWGAVAIFAGGVDCLQRVNASATLGALLEAIDPRLLRAASAHARAVYVRTLSFGRGGGAPSALLRELYIAMGSRAFGSRWGPSQ
ncbi:hypothetical protein KFE25_013778 [Diacronema lutheri]|uniref:Exostosin GT47 domain-containing protein n=1 Tax=Diacronema lutheri TaxID=2081491 RepID=A0A8J6CG49_DIALT|nr:hypothetical protein KFE25_013778 [Diacronema lutheri]